MKATDLPGLHYTLGLAKRDLSLTLLMLRLRSFKTQGRRDFLKSSKLCHVGIHWKALSEYRYSQMSIMCQGFSYFSGLFCIILQLLN